MLLGIGCDIVQIPRIVQSYQRYGSVFLKRIMAEQELLLLPENDASPLFTAHLAKRYAAKEALAKAAGIGIGSQLAFRDAVVLNDSNGRPYFHADTCLLITRCFGVVAGRVRIHLSLSDDYPIAVAYVVIEETAGSNVLPTV